MFKWNLQHVLKGVLPQLHRQGFDSTHQEQLRAGLRGDSKNSRLENQPGRVNSRRHIESFTRRLKNSVQESFRMAKVLSRATRIEETERVRERAERRGKQAVEIVRLVKQPGFHHYQSMMERTEADAYFALRSPSALKKDGMSLEYFVGFYAGVLSLVDDFKNVADVAAAEVEKARERANKEAKEK